MPTFGSLFAGIGGFDLGLERVGWECWWQVENDKRCNEVLAHRWPGVERFDDVREVGAAELAGVDLICGGFPCQDLSVAGKRAGLDGQRSRLWEEFRRVVSELRPAWLFVENVPGLLSSNEGRDMGALLGQVGELGYRWAYRVLDSQHFGVVQRRRRVFIVGYLGDGRHPAEVLFDAASLQRHPSTRREEGTQLARNVAASLRGGGGSERGWHNDAEHGLTVAAQCHGSNVGPMGHLRRGNGGVTSGVPFVTHTLTAPDPNALPKDGKRQDGSRQDRIPVVAYPVQTKHRDGDCQDTYITHTLTHEGFDAGEDGTGRGTPVVIAYSLGSHAGAADGDQSNKSHNSGGPVGMGIQEEMSHSLRSGRTQAVAFADNQRGEIVTGDTHHQLSCGGGKPGQGYPAVFATRPRRLTPRECERLQGFPDDWTLVNDMADGPRYRMLGNAVTVQVVEWIGKRISVAM